MKTSEIRELSVIDLQERIETEKVNLNKLNIDHSISPVENPTKIRKARRDVARMLTILAEKQNNR